MDALYLILYVLAAVFFFFAALWGWRAGGPRAWALENLVALGLLCWVLVPLIMKARSM